MTRSAQHTTQNAPPPGSKDWDPLETLTDLLALSPTTPKMADRLYANPRDPAALPPRRRVINDLYRNATPAHLDEFTRTVEQEMGTQWGIYADDPIGFVHDVLHETTWSMQRQVLWALLDDEHKRVAVPSAFGTGKTHIAARAAVWRATTHPPGTSLTVTTATRFRQVQRQLWPHIRRCIERAHMSVTQGGPVQVDLTQMKMKVPGTDQFEDVAYGFSAPPGDEAAVQGIHAPKLFIVVDEAGGIGAIIGEALRGLMTGDDTRQLSIGNPPTDNEGSWFERHTRQPGVKTLRISAYQAPLQTGERVACHTCPPTVPRHMLGVHLVDQAWIDEAIHDHGRESAFVLAKVDALFPRGGASKTIPATWVDMAVENPEPEGLPGYRRLCDLGLEDETSTDLVADGAWVRLGVDVAADGGDELAISRAVGDLFGVRHTSSGADNAESMVVAGKILAEIKVAERLRYVLGTSARVRVKIDAIGVGWAVAGLLRQWGKDGVHGAEIVPVKVSENTDREETTTLRPYRKRDEMWLAGRHILAPSGGGSTVRLRVDKHTAAQLSAPNYETNAQGKTVVESKKSMRRRGIASPDRAESVLLALYEPAVRKKRKATVLAGA